MASDVGIVDVWHRDLSILPVITGECVDNFVKLQCVATDTSIGGYKFFQECYIHDLEGMLMRDARPRNLRRKR